MAADDVVGVPGGRAGSPTQVPRRGWWQVLRRAARRSGEDQVALMAAGIAFFGFLALVPSAVAASLVYGLVAEPATVDRHLGTLAQVLPAQGATLVGDQLEALRAQERPGLGLGLVVAVLGALGSVWVGMSHLVAALDRAYAETARGLVRRRLTAAVLTLGAIVTFTTLVGLVAVFPVLVDTSGLPGTLLQLGRWSVLAVLAVVVLGVLYRYAPHRRAATVPWVSVGAVLATAGWLLTSAGLSLYVSTFGAYGQAYGALAGVPVLLVWMWLTTVAVLLGAEVNAEAEHQTAADTTVGPDRPRGRRGAVKADTAVGRPDP